jgi:hypothetical protein
MDHSRGLCNLCSRPIAEDSYSLMMLVSLLSTFLALILIEDSAHAQISAPNCTDSTFAWVSPPWSAAQSLKLISRCFLINCALSHSTRSHRVHAKLELFWRRCATMVVSTSYHSPSSFACELNPPMQHLPSLPCSHSIHTPVRAVKTMVICANATQSSTI